MHVHVFKEDILAFEIWNVFYWLLKIPVHHKGMEHVLYDSQSEAAYYSCYE